jgi:hypothetical protein
MSVVQAFWKDFYGSRAVGVRPDRRLSGESTFFTMGSCFANEIRAELMRRGMTVLPAINPGLHPHFFDRSEASSWGPWDERVHLQFYNTFSIRQEIEKAFGYWEQGPDDYWELTLPNGMKLHQDPYRRRVLSSSREGIRAVTRGLDAGMRAAAAQADVFVFTLGLTEVWKKKDNQLVTCTEPGYAGGGGQGLCWFHPSTYTENLENMRRVLQLIGKHRPDARVFVTVSPVGLGRTFRDVDIAVANMESKSTLRAVAAALCAEHPTLSYVPSYELCIYDWERAFREDGRHVRPEKVRQIMDLFMDSFFVDGRETKGAAAERPAVEAPAQPAPVAAPPAADTRRQALLQAEARAVTTLERALQLPDPRAQQVAQTFLRGYRAFVEGGAVPDDAYMAMRALYVATQGGLDKVIDGLLQPLFPPAPAGPRSSPLLGDWGAAQQEGVLRNLKAQGYAMLPVRLDPAWLATLRADLLALPMRDNGEGPIVAAADRDPAVGRYLAVEDELLALPAVGALATDPVLLALIEAYLGCQPVFDMTACMFSQPGDRTQIEQSKSAQLFHFDKDRISFIKAFLYMTDVGPDDGPHVFCAGTHAQKPGALWRDGRFTDNDVVDRVGKAAVRTITGPAGTLFLADTRAFHRGSVPKAHHRLLFQLEYTSSLFGRHYPTRHSLQTLPWAAAAAEARPRLVTRFL